MLLHHTNAYLVAMLGLLHPVANSPLTLQTPILSQFSSCGSQNSQYIVRPACRKSFRYHGLDLYFHDGLRYKFEGWIFKKNIQTYNSLLPVLIFLIQEQILFREPI